MHRDFFLVVLAKELCGHKNGLLCWCVYVFVFFSVNLKDVYDFLKWACGCRHTYFIVQYIFFNKNSLTTSSLSLLALNIIILGSHMWSCPPVMSKEYNRVITSLYTDVVFFFFFRSFRKHRWAGKHVGRKNSSSPTTTPLCWRSINPLQFIFYHPRSTNFEEKIEGLWTG